jgi:anaerobic selenocysteine-containing dehydrogenase
MQLYVKDGRLKMIEPDAKNLATPEGVCLKGLSYVERVYSSDRILQPLRRVEKNNAFRPISWDEALNVLVDKISLFRDKYGPHSILYYFGSGTKGLLNAVGLNFWRLLGGCTTTYGDLCWPAGLEATRLTLGENKHNAPWDIANAKLVILWGKNAAETNIHQMYYIDKALENGGKLIVIDPRRTQSAERAELLIQPRPGSDGSLALAVAHLLFKNNQVDLDFIERHVFGYELFKNMVDEFTPQKASHISDVPITYIERLAEYMGTIKPLTINAGFGMQRYTNSGQTMRAMIALLALTGNIGKPGAGWIFANLQSCIFDQVKDPLAFYPPQEPDGIVRVSISTTRLGQDILQTDHPPLKMIWVERGNPVTQNPDTNTVLKAFRSLDFRVVIDQFMTDTAREADLILPAKTMFEQSDIIGAYWHPYIQLKQKIIDPPGEVKPESAIYYLLAQKLGLDLDTLQHILPGPTDRQIEAYLAKKLESFPQISIDRLKAGPIIAPGHQEIAFSDLIFPTPSGRIELYSQEAQERWGQDPLPIYQESVESIRHNTEQAVKYPLYFMTPNTKNRIHSQFNNLKLIRQFSEKALVYINPADARDKRIRQGDNVRIYNDRGELTLQARLDFSMKMGCIAVSNGWWIGEGGTVNFCSLGRETDMGHGAAFHDNLVDIEKII